MGRLINKSPLSNNTFNLNSISLVNDYKGPRGDYNIQTKNVVDENGIVTSQELEIVDSMQDLIDLYDITLPEELQSMTTLNYIVFNDVLVLNNSTPNLWRYNFKDRTWKQLVSESGGGSYNTFIVIKDKCICKYSMTGSTIHHWIYDSILDDVVQLNVSAIYNWLVLSSGDMLFDNNTKTYLYKYDTNEISELSTTKYSRPSNGFYVEKGTKCIYSTTTTTASVVVFDSVDNTITPILTGISNTSYSVSGTKITDRYYLLSATTSSITGFAILDLDNITATLISNSGSYFLNGVIYGNYLYVSSTSSLGGSDSLGLIKVNLDDYSYEKISTTGRNFTNSIRIGNKLFFTSTDETVYDFIIDELDNTVNNLTLKYGGFKLLASAGKCLLWHARHPGGDSRKLLYYNEVTNTVDTINSSFYAGYYCKLPDDRVLFGAAGTNYGVWLYLPETNTAPNIYKSGTYFDIFTKISDDVIQISSSKPKDNPRVLEFNALDDSVKLAGLKIQE